MFPKNLRYLREKNNMEQIELANLLGRKSSSSISEWEKGKYTPKLGVLNEISKIFKVEIDDLMNKDLSSDSQENISKKIFDITKKLEPTRQQIVYDTAKQQLHEQESTIEENNICYLPTIENSPAAANPTELAYGDVSIEDQAFVDVPDGADFAVPIHGNSMEPVIQDGDYVFVKTQNHIENGEIALVEIDGDGVTCKKIFFNPENGSIILHSLNAEYDDRELDPEHVRIVGKVLV